MLSFNTATLERNRIVEESFQTHPYEAGWASEAIFFVDIRQLDDSKAKLDAAVQISPDGVNWTDEGSGLNDITADGVYFVKVSKFGGFLRLDVKISGHKARCKLTIHLVLKG